MIRHYRYLKPVEVSLLTQRRVSDPFGLEGVKAGARGRNIRVIATGETIEIPEPVAYAAESGEGLIIETPGGGDWGG